MKQLTRDLYTSGRVWLSLSHNFSQNTGSGGEFDLVKVNRDFVTLNAGTLFILSFWSTGVKTPDKFYIPEYKIEEFRSILISLNELRSDETYIRDGELTAQAKPATLYYRLALNNKKYFDVYFVENNFNGDKAINIAIEFDSKVYFLYDSNVIDLIEVIPSPGEIARYKQSAAELYYMETFSNATMQKTLDGIQDTLEIIKEKIGIEGTTTSTTKKVETSNKTTKAKKAEPRTITKVDRTNITRPDIIIPTHEEEEVVYNEDTKSVEMNLETGEVAVLEKDNTKTILREGVQPETKVVEETSTPEVSKSGFDYSKLLEDE